MFLLSYITIYMASIYICSYCNTNTVVCLWTSHLYVNPHTNFSARMFNLNYERRQSMVKLMGDIISKILTGLGVLVLSTIFIGACIALFSIATASLNIVYVIIATIATLIVAYAIGNSWQ